VPEGDTIHKLAGALRAWLVGRRLLDGRVAARPTLALAGRTVEQVSARGKHLFLGLDGGLVLRSHLGMHGSWHRYRPGERWRRPGRSASIVLATDDDVLVCFRASEVELLDRDRLHGFALRRRLGPDVLDEAPRGELVARRARSVLEQDAPLVDLLLDQRVACGIGNVYKSEVLFLQRLHPCRPWTEVDEDTLGRLYAVAHRLLGANLGAGPRVTRASPDAGARLWVYRRAGLPCHTCATPIATARLGRGLRSSYWCPRCQPAGPSAASERFGLLR
jgi:endonuclease-8